jgi:transposase
MLRGLASFEGRSSLRTRTFSWFGQSRRLSKDYERLPETSEALIYATMSRIMLKRLAAS